jgi:succinate-acetate transporter protein
VEEFMFFFSQSTFLRNNPFTFIFFNLTFDFFLLGIGSFAMSRKNFETWLKLGFANKAKIC